MARIHRLADGTMWTITDIKTAEARLKRKPDAAVRWLVTYAPQSKNDPNGLWKGDVATFVRTQIARITTLDVVSTRRYVRVLAYLSMFCVREGISLDIEEVLHPDTVERFVIVMRRSHPDSTVGTWRSDLRHLGPALTAKAPWEPPLRQLSHTGLPDPYKAGEVSVIVRDVSRQIQPLDRRVGTVIVGLGLGAGLDGRWNTKVGCSDVSGTGPVTIDVPNPAKRLVVVRSAYEADLARLAAGGDGPLVGISSTSKNLSSELAARIVIDGGRLVLNPARLRATWLLDHLNAGTPLNILLEAAGLKTVRTLSSFIEKMTDVPREEVERQLRGV